MDPRPRVGGNLQLQSHRLERTCGALLVEKEPIDARARRLCEQGKTRWHEFCGLGLTGPEHLPLDTGEEEVDAIDDFDGGGERGITVGVGVSDLPRGNCGPATFSALPLGKPPGIVGHEFGNPGRWCDELPVGFQGFWVEDRPPDADEQTPEGEDAGLENGRGMHLASLD